MGYLSRIRTPGFRPIALQLTIAGDALFLGAYQCTEAF